jgi:nitrate reductase (NAD(P)H)
MDATDEFNSIHSSKAKAMLKDYYIGELVTAEQKAAALAAAAGSKAAAAISLTADSSSHANGVANGVANGASNNAAGAAANGVSSSSSSAELVALDPRKKIPFKLAEKIELSHNVRLFRFALQSPQHKFGLPVGKHVFLYASIGGETVMRAYTPTSQDKDLGHFDLVIKVYR